MLKESGWLRNIFKSENKFLLLKTRKDRFALRSNRSFWGRWCAVNFSSLLRSKNSQQQGLVHSGCYPGTLSQCFHYSDFPLKWLKGQMHFWSFILTAFLTYTIHILCGYSQRWRVLQESFYGFRLIKVMVMW